ncbi:hypothetical protein [Bacillus sp. JCM 19041]|uniref:hypothetical protein n=1 Tax=Bacillus sp. JCM 19041 TaxID=1460637 RepID=UPI0006CFC61E
MRKNHLLLSLGLVSVITLAACGSSDDASTETAEAETPASEETSNDNTNEEEASEENDSDTSDNKWETQVGETIENEGGSFTLVARQDNIETVETGPMTLDIPQLNIQDVDLSDDLLEFVGFELPVLFKLIWKSVIHPMMTLTSTQAKQQLQQILANNSKAICGSQIILMVNF